MIKNIYWKDESLGQNSFLVNSNNIQQAAKAKGLGKVLVPTQTFYKV